MTVSRPAADDLPPVTILDPEAARTLAASLIDAADRGERFAFGQFPAAVGGWPQ